MSKFGTFGKLIEQFPTFLGSLCRLKFLSEKYKGRGWRYLRFPRSMWYLISWKTVTLPSSTIIVSGKTLLQPLAGLRHSQIGDPGRTVRQSAPDRIRSPRIIRPRRCINSSSSRISRVSNVPLDRHGGIRRPAIRSRWHREICSSPCLVIEIHPTWLIEFPIFRT